MRAEKARRKASPSPSAAAQSASRPSAIVSWIALLDRHAVKFTFALILLASIRIVATYDVFSHTSDEPAHIACGIEWLDKGVYRWEAQHPPLARVAGALGPYLLGHRYHGKRKDDMSFEGLTTLFEGNRYDETMFAARAGILPFFWVAGTVVFLWTRRDFGGAAAVIAVFLFTFIPPVLAHAGLATTDMALTAFLGAAFLAARNWLERPTAATGAAFGACGALAILSKFSSLAFFPVAVIFALGAYAAAGRLAFDRLGRRLLGLLPSFGIAIAVVLPLIWAMYRFSFGKVDGSGISLPAPELFKGIGDVFRHNARGHMNYLFGHVSEHGFLAYYPVALGVKTPAALLLLAGAGIVFLKREWRRSPALLLPASYAAGILAVAFFSNINIGIRHILPVYTGLTILASVAVLRLAESAPRLKWATPVLAVLLVWYSLSSLLAHPDYLPYFNEIAGSHPENILVDSDLDWGQDMKRLEKRLLAAGAKVATISSTYWITNDRPGAPFFRKGNGETPVAGWNAVGLTEWKMHRFGFFDSRLDLKFWPDLNPPQETIGKSIYLWYFPPGNGLR